MSAVDILLEINKLPLSERLGVVEKALRNIRLEEQSERMRVAAERLRHDYLTDPELTAFTALDGEPVYESM
jgi:hypothetical protein